MLLDDAPRVVRARQGLYNGAMHLALVGLSHMTAPLEVRESAAFDPSAAAWALADLVRAGEDGCREAAILSTCNRTEVYAVGPTASAAQAAASRSLASRLPDDSQRERWLYSAFDQEAARHLFRVAAGLDSLVLGEAQILGQVRAALALSGAAAGPVISRLFREALTLGKRVRRETGIGDGAASVSYAAVELAKKIFGRLDGTSVLLVGAGKMAELAVKNLAAAGVRSVVIANRSPAGAERLVQALRGSRPGVHAAALALEAVVAQLGAVDIVISSTSAKAPVIRETDVRSALKHRRGRPLFLIDIAVPRDVEPEVHALDGVFLYNIDDLQNVVSGNLSERAAHAAAAERLVADGVGAFATWLAERQAVPVITAWRGRAEAVRTSELRKALRQLDHLDPADKAKIAALTSAIVNKLLHQPTIRLKEACTATPERSGLAHGGDARRVYLQVASDLFAAPPGSQIAGERAAEEQAAPLTRAWRQRGGV